MNTPIADFVNKYRESGTARLHMPGHKGRKHLGFEDFDITEIAGADVLSEGEGIIGESESNATALFETRKTVYSTEGSTQCIKAMLTIAAMQKNTDKNVQPVFVAGRNAHKAFIYGAAMLDAKVVWMYPTTDNICECNIKPEQLEKTLQDLEKQGIAVTGVYVTSPDYLGNMIDIAGLAEVAHKYKTLMLVDNAHGAYLKFLNKRLHPMELGADICCDSAHKTLPVLTGGAYLHISKNAPEGLESMAKHALSIYCSTSPSYLILESLDNCNKYIAEEYKEHLRKACERLEITREKLKENGWRVKNSDPLKLTIEAPDGMTGDDLAEFLRNAAAEPEYTDDRYVVMMFTPDNNEQDYRIVEGVFGKSKISYEQNEDFRIAQKKNSPEQCKSSEQVISIREAVFSKQEPVPVEKAEGRICAAPTVACPPAIPIAISGERITKAAVEEMKKCGIKQISCAFMKNQINS